MKLPANKPTTTCPHFWRMLEPPLSRTAAAADVVVCATPPVRVPLASAEEPEPEELPCVNQRRMSVGAYTGGRPCRAAARSCENSENAVAESVVGSSWMKLLSSVPWSPKS